MSLLRNLHLVYLSLVRYEEVLWPQCRIELVTDPPKPNVTTVKAVRR